MTTKQDLAALAAEAIQRGHPVKRLPDLTPEERLDRELQRILDDQKKSSVTWLFSPPPSRP